jgi:toxin ParE1/3/4
LTLTFAARARDDLRSIISTIARDNPIRAISFVVELEQRCAALTGAPLAYGIVTRYNVQAIRRIMHGRYLIFYRVREDQITILRVLHGSMDIDAQLAEE